MPRGSRLRDLSLDELLELQHELHIRSNKGEVGVLHELVNVDKALIATKNKGTSKTKMISPT